MRYIGHKYKGLKGECLYPPNSQPEAMHAVDDILEYAEGMMNAVGGMIIPFMDSYKDRENGWETFLTEKFPKILGDLEEKKKKRGL